MKYRCRMAAGMISFVLIFAIPVSRAEETRLCPDCPLTYESVAYQNYLDRPVSDLSRLLYLIERFGDMDLKIRYNGIYFKAAYAARFARWFLSRHYKGESPEEWIKKWCYTSFPGGQLIWVQFPNGKFEKAYQVLEEEIERLDRLTAKRVADAVSAQAVDQLVHSTAVGPSPIQGPEQAIASPEVVAKTPVSKL